MGPVGRGQLCYVSHEVPGSAGLHVGPARHTMQRQQIPQRAVEVLDRGDRYECAGHTRTRDGLQVPAYGLEATIRRPQRHGSVDHRRGRLAIHPTLALHPAVAVNAALSPHPIPAARCHTQR